MDLEKFLDDIRLTEINNVVDDGLLLFAPAALEATLRPKLHRFVLSLYLLQTWLYSISATKQATNRLSGV